MISSPNDLPADVLHTVPATTCPANLSIFNQLSEMV